MVLPVVIAGLTILTGDGGVPPAGYSTCVHHLLTNAPMTTGVETDAPQSSRGSRRPYPNDIRRLCAAIRHNSVGRQTHQS